MAAVDVGDVRQVYEIDTLISDDRVQFCLDKAISDVKRKIGIEAYGEIFEGDTSTLEDSAYLDENTTTTDEEALRTRMVTNAVIDYTMSNVIINSNLRIRPSGQVKKETDSGSPGFTQSSQITNEYLSPTEAMAWADKLKSQADEAILPYVIQQEPVNPYGFAKLVRG